MLLDITQRKVDIEKWFRLQCWDKFRRKPENCCAEGLFFFKYKST